jgi:hypothetical protein
MVSSRVNNGQRQLANDRLLPAGIFLLPVSQAGFINAVSREKRSRVKMDFE